MKISFRCRPPWKLASVEEQPSINYGNELKMSINLPGQHQTSDLALRIHYICNKNGVSQSHDPEKIGDASLGLHH